MSKGQLCTRARWVFSKVDREPTSSHAEMGPWGQAISSLDFAHSLHKKIRWYMKIFIIFSHLFYIFSHLCQIFVWFKFRCVTFLLLFDLCIYVAQIWSFNMKSEDFFFFLISLKFFLLKSWVEKTKWNFFF